jgi:hypothetical protein
MMTAFSGGSRRQAGLRDRALAVIYAQEVGLVAPSGDPE